MNGRKKIRCFCRKNDRKILFFLPFTPALSYELPYLMKIYFLLKIHAIFLLSFSSALSGEPGRVVVIVSCASCKQPIICNSCQAQRAETRHDRLQSTESSDTDCDQIDKEDNRDEAAGERRGSDDSIESLPEKAEATPSGGERNVVEKRASPVLEMNITEKEPNI